jgi:Icc-related predicted phosphoesterase
MSHPTYFANSVQITGDLQVSGGINLTFQKQTFHITNTDIINKYITLSGTPTTNSVSVLWATHAPPLETVDYTIVGNTVTFITGSNLQMNLVSGDILQVSYY